MRSWKRWAVSGLAAVVVATGLSAVTAAPGAGAANSTTCPLAALKKADQAGRDHVLALDEPRARRDADQAHRRLQLVAERREGQPGQPDRLRADLHRSTRPASRTGDLPDIVQLQETEQQQMIDTQTVLPAGVCAKADKYSFSDFLPRIISYFTVEGTQYAMPFNNSGPVLFYNKKAFTAAGLDPEKPPTTLDDVRAAAEKLKANGVEAPLGLKTEPGYFEHWRAMANKLYVNNSNGRKARATKTVYDDATGREIFSLAVGHGEGRPRHHEPRPRHRQLRQPARHPERLARDGVRHQRRARHHHLGARRPATTRTSSIGVAPLPGPSHKGGVLVSGGSLYMVNKSAPEKQAAAWKFLKFLDEPENMTTWAIGTGYIPIRKSSADSAEMQQYWAQNPTYKVAYDQLLDRAGQRRHLGVGDRQLHRRA